MIRPSVCPAITSLIFVRDASGFPAKSASANVAAARLSAAVNSARGGRPDWTQTVFGARNVAAGEADAAGGARRSAPAATSSAPGDPSRCRARASSSAVRPRAPHRAIRSALATLAGENTVSAASWASTWYRSEPNAASACAASACTPAGAAARGSVEVDVSSRIAPYLP